MRTLYEESHVLFSTIYACHAFTTHHAPVFHSTVPRFIFSSLRRRKFLCTRKKSVVCGCYCTNKFTWIRCHSDRAPPFSAFSVTHCLHFFNYVDRPCLRYVWVHLVLIYACHFLFLPLFPLHCRYTFTYTFLPFCAAFWFVYISFQAVRVHYFLAPFLLWFDLRHHFLTFTSFCSFSLVTLWTHAFAGPPVHGTLSRTPDATPTVYAIKYFSFHLLGIRLAALFYFHREPSRRGSYGRDSGPLRAPYLVPWDLCVYGRDFIAISLHFLTGLDTPTYTPAPHHICRIPPLHYV